MTTATLSKSLDKENENEIAVISVITHTNGQTAKTGSWDACNTLCWGSMDLGSYTTLSFSYSFSTGMTRSPRSPMRTFTRTVSEMMLQALTESSETEKAELESDNVFLKEVIRIVVVLNSKESDTYA
jgi:hypothetical protein